MWRQVCLTLPLIISTLAIKVPVDNVETPADSKNDTQNEPVYYASEDSNIDSYLIPPDPHKPEEVESDIATPATYLLPPSPDQQTNYYYTPTKADEQSDWLPIEAQPQVVPVEKQKLRNGKLLNRGKIAVPIPSDHLEPPNSDASSEYVVPTPSTELELPLEDQREQFVPELVNVHPKYKPILSKDQILIRIPNEQTISPHLLPPRLLPVRFRNPTKLYPKKFPGTFKPVPIPIGRFVEDGLPQVPRAKPVKYFQPIPIDEISYLTPSEEKQRYLYEQAELKRKLKEEEATKLQSPAVEAHGDSEAPEQETSATLHRYPARPIPLRQAPIPAPLRQAPPPTQAQAPSNQHDANAPAPDDRTEFRMHGMKGPHSYQFGYDTGKGKNRQFRYEERDNDGIVRGHYGYMDKHGKLRVVNYRAHPELGFQADAPVEKE